MRTRLQPLLAELHAHTTWSDGELNVRQLVDLVGGRGFDVLCITDHVVRGDDPWLDQTERREQGVARDDHDAYLAEIECEGGRARSLYDLLVVPGLELTYNDLDPGAAAHAVAIGLRDFVSVDRGIDGAIHTAKQAGAAIIAAHPYHPGAGPGPAPEGPGRTQVPPPGRVGGRVPWETRASGDAPCASRLTQRWAGDESPRGLAHRFELFNRTQLFGWVAEAGLPAVAAGDIHTPEHVYGWKTLLPCRKDEESVIGYLRSRRPVYLARLERQPERLAA